MRPISPHMSYADWLTEAGLGANTIRQRVQFLTSRLNDWGTLDVSGTLIVTWLNGYDGWTRYTYTNHLRSIYAWRLDTDPHAHDPLARFRQPRQPRPHASPLEDHELRAVLDSATGDVRSWMMLAYLAGLRTHEIAKFRGCDITRDSIHVIGKGDHEAWLPTHPDLWALAQQYPRQDYWFPSTQARRVYVSTSLIGNQVRANFRANGITTGATHRLRHTFATHLHRNGISTPIIQQMLRHSSLDTTEAYIGLNAAEMAAAVRTLDLWAPAQVESNCQSCGAAMAA